MNIKIMSRDAIEMFCEHPFVERIALVSITDYGYDFAELKNKPHYLLQLAFDDVDGDVFVDELGDNPSHEDKLKIEKKYHMFSDEQAKQIVEFVNDVWDKVDVIIFQCEHGQSRSAAITAAITQFKYKNGIEIFADDKYYPNKFVYRKIFNFLNAEK
jgi:predicted protein tyrosine phosphatase